MMNWLVCLWTMNKFVEGIKTEVKQLETLKVGRNMTESEVRKISREKSAKILTSRWILTQKTPSLTRCRLVVWDFASGAKSAFRSEIYAPSSSLDSLRCDLVLLPSNISYKGERVVCLLFKAMNGLRRAPLLWFYQLQRTVYSLGGEDTFESTLFRLSTKRGLVLILVYVDDLLIAVQDQEEGEAFLSKLQAIWKMKVTERIPCRKKRALEFLGRTIYRSKDGESALYFGVNRQYMTSIFESWSESVKIHAQVGRFAQGSCQEVWWRVWRVQLSSAIGEFLANLRGQHFQEQIYLFQFRFCLVFRQSLILRLNIAWGHFWNG